MGRDPSVLGSLGLGVKGKTRVYCTVHRGRSLGCVIHVRESHAVSRSTSTFWSHADARANGQLQSCGPRRQRLFQGTAPRPVRIVLPSRTPASSANAESATPGIALLAVLCHCALAALPPNKSPITRGRSADLPAHDHEQPTPSQPSPSYSDEPPTTQMSILTGADLSSSMSIVGSEPSSCAPASTSVRMTLRWPRRLASMSAVCPHASRASMSHPSVSRST